MEMSQEVQTDEQQPLSHPSQARNISRAWLYVEALVQLFILDSESINKVANK